MDWLILMQHNGVPTRLLDWSESPLVALFFAVSQDEKVDGELWAMFPPSLNTASIGEPVELPKPSNNFLKFLAYEGVGWNSFAALDRLGMSRTPMGPIAFEPPYTHPRMTAQLSTFTIHPNPILRVLQYGMPSVPKRYTTPQKQKTITESLLSERELVRYEIPAGAKQRIKEGLRCVGITDRTLFMDLDSLGREIRLELASGVFVEPVSPPAPSNENARSVTTDANETERVEERGTNDAS
ncbi:MAG: hypothetical protein DHS20C16_08290 [Phycisphaerae bacterium]|nr:MAG: hypothetical protein DHS20C16_08290 [Phycisphaerae bacterium]